MRTKTNRLEQVFHKRKGTEAKPELLTRMYKFDSYSSPTCFLRGIGASSQTPDGVRSWGSARKLLQKSRLNQQADLNKVTEVQTRRLVYLEQGWSDVHSPLRDSRTPRALPLQVGEEGRDGAQYGDLTKSVMGERVTK